MFLSLERHPSSSYSSRYMSFFFNEILTIPASFKHIFSGVPGKKHILHGHSAQQVCPCDRVKPMGRENGGAQRVMTL